MILLTLKEIDDLQKKFGNVLHFYDRGEIERKQAINKMIDVVAKTVAPKG